MMPVEFPGEDWGSDLPQTKNKKGVLA